VSHIKIRKLLFTRLKTKHNALVLRDHVIQFFTWRYWWYNIFFKSTYKEVIYALCICVRLARTNIQLQLKKNMFLPPFLRWRPCYFHIVLDMLIFNGALTRNYHICMKIIDSLHQNFILLKNLFSWDIIH
jgi:hypothetical protein